MAVEFDPLVDEAAGSGQAAVLYSALSSHPQLIDAPNPNCFNRMPLHHAAEKGHAQAIEILVKAGSTSIDAATDEGWTAMHLAATGGHAQVIETLIRLGSTSIDGRRLRVKAGKQAPIEGSVTPLHVAVDRGHREAVRMLLRLGSRAADTLADDRLTPAQVVHNQQINAAARQLVDVSSTRQILTTEFARTPLAIAIIKRRRKIVSDLLKAGADLARTAAHTRSKSFDEGCAELSDFPAIRLVQFFNLKTHRLTFKNARISNETAACLPLRNWRSCEGIDFRGNPDLTEIPTSLAVLDPNHPMKLKFDLATHWNTVEEQIIGKSSRELIEYAQLKARGHSVPINEHKLMAVGYAAVGKTTLIRRLKDEDYNHPVSTDGVDMGELKLRSDTGETIRIVVWDFAGQPLYRQTHLLFLRNPGLCLLLFKLTDDVGKSVEQLRFWCETLRSFSEIDKMRVLLVGTHLDRCADRSQAEQLANQVRQQLQAFLPFPEPAVLVSCANGREYEQTIAHLKSSIRRMATSMNTRAPACIEIVRKALLPVAATNIPLLSGEAAHELVVEYATQVKHARLIADAKLREMCLRALQTLGSVMVLEKRGRMTHVVVNPQWVALLLATVVTTRHTWITRGRVTFGTLSSQVWRGNPRFPVETHDTLVTILEQLKIVFSLEKRRGAAGYLPSQMFFIPCALPEQRPHIRFSALPPNSAEENADDKNESSSSNENNTLRRWFKVLERGGCIPVGVLPEVIVQLMTLPNTKLLEVWQQGGVFRIKDSPSSSSSTSFSSSSLSSNGVVVSVCKLAADTIEVIVQSSEVHLNAGWIRDVSTMVENQLTDVYHIGFEVRAPCGPGAGSCFVPLDLLRACILQSVPVRCVPAGKHQVRVDRLAPDLLFADLGYQSFVHQWSTVQLISQLGKGACGKVMLGRLTSTTLVQSSSSSSSSSASSSSSSSMTKSVAVKLLEDAERGQVPNDLIKNYREFQHEAYLMSLLQHPNIVRFVGVCFPSEQPQAEHERVPALMMEVVDGGTLYQSLCDSVGILQVCDLAIEIMKTVGAFNLQHSLFVANPNKHACPAPLPPFHGVADGAVGRINHIFEQRIFGRANELRCSDPVLDRLRELQQQLGIQLEAFYNGPVTRLLKEDTEKTLEEVKSLNDAVAEVVLPMKWSIRLKLVTDVVQGLMYLHSRTPPIIHRDFKTLNMFLKCRLDTVDLTSIDWRQPLVKIGDFGLSIRMLGTKELKVNNTHNLSEVNPTWTAPEVLSKNNYSIEADVYGLGISMWEVLMRAHPFSNIYLPLLANHVIDGGRPLIPPEVASTRDVVVQEFMQVMQRCWHQDPDQRPRVGEVYCSLRDLCRREAPEVFVTLPELTTTMLSPPPTNRSSQVAEIPTRMLNYEVAHVEPITLIDGKSTTSKVLCLQAVGDHSVWVGFSTGNVVVLQFNDTPGHFPAAIQSISCNDTDRHERAVSAMCFNAAQQMTVWSGSQDGRIFVWSTDIEDLNSAKQRCYLKTKFVLINSNSTQLNRFKGKPLHCVLRNGKLHCYPDEHVGPPCFELDLCRGDLLATAQGGKLDLTAESTRVILQPASCHDDTDDDPVHIWQRTVTRLSQLTTNEFGSLLRLAVSSKRSRCEFITALEATDESTWCLSLSTLVEWQLLETQHGLHSQLRVEPARRLTFDINCEQFSRAQLRSVCNVIWVAPNVLWIGAANTIAFIDLTQITSEARSDSSTSSLSSTESFSADGLHPPASPCVRCYQAHEGRCSDFFAQQPASPRSLSASSDGTSAEVECFECSKSLPFFRRRRPCQNCQEFLCHRCWSISRFCRNCLTSSQPPQLVPEPKLIDHSPYSSMLLQWPRADKAHQHVDAIRLLALVESRASQSGFEVWSYALHEDIFVWRTPLRSLSPDDQQQEDDFAPVFLDRVLVPSIPERPLLTCMKQVGDQVWAGTRDGTIIGWDVATRAPLAKQPLTAEMRGRACDEKPVSDIAAMWKKRGRELKHAISSGHDQTLRLFSFGKHSS